MAIILKYKFDPSISSNPKPNISGGGTQTTQDVNNADGTITRTIEFTSNPTRIYFGGSTSVNKAYLEVLEYPINSTMTSFYYLFDGCTNLTYINSANWDTSNISDFDYCFRNCSSLKTIDITGWNLSNAGYMGSMFGNCSSLETLILDSTTGWSRLSTGNNILGGDTKLTKIYMRNSTYTEINHIITKALIDNGGGKILVDDVDNEELIDKTTANSKNWTVDSEYVVKYIHTTGVSTVPTFNSGFTFTTTSKDNGDGTTTIGIKSDSLPTTISFANLTGLLEVVSGKLNNITTLNDMFDGCTSLHTVSLKNVDLSNIQNASYLFNNCSSLVNVNAMKTWKNRQNLTTIDYMFSGCSSLSSLECFNGWDLTNTSVTGLFNGCTSLNYLTASSSNIASINKLINALPTKTATTTGNIKIAPIKMADVNTSTAQSKFWNIDDNATLVTSFKVPADSTTMPVITSEEDLIITTNNDADGNKIVSIYVGIVLPTLISFKNCSDVIEVYEIHKDIINNMDKHSELFYGCSALKRINTTGWTVEKSTDLSSMFCNCVKLETVDVSSFNTVNVGSYMSMFSNCMKLKSITGIENWNTASLFTASDMFSYTYELETVDVSNFDMTKCTSTNMMFYYSGVKHLDLSKWKFEYTGEFDLARMFYCCYNLEDVGDLSGWGIKYMEYISSIFTNCISLKTLNISNWDLSSGDHHSPSSGVETCHSLETINVTNLRIGSGYVNQGTNTPTNDPVPLFGDCYSLREIIGWETITFDRSANINRLFYGTDALDEIDFSNKDMQYITTMQGCFGDSQNLKHVNLSNTNLKQLSQKTFDSGYNCPKFRFLNLDGLLSNADFTIEADVFSDDTPDLAVVTANGAYDAYIDQLIKRLPARTQDDPGIIKVFNPKMLTNRIDDERPSRYERFDENVLKHTYLSGDIDISYDTIADEKVFFYFGNTKKLDLPIKSAKLTFTTKGYYAYANYYDKNGNQISGYTDPGWIHEGNFEIDVTSTLDDVLSADKSNHGWIRVIVPSDRSASMYIENVCLYIEYDRSEINEPTINLELAKAKFWNMESTNVIAEYTFNNSVPVMPVFNDGYTGYEIIDTDNGDGTTTRRIVHDTTLPTSMSFKNCTGLIKVHRIDLSNITHSTSMFEGCINLQSIGRHYGMFKPINTTAMFKNCSSLTKIDLSTWFATDIKYTSDMFNGCALLSELIIDDLGRKCTQAPAVTTMFAGCTSLKNISIQDSSPIMVKAIIEQIPTKTADEPGHLNIRGVKVENVENISVLETKNWTVEDRHFLVTYRFDPNKSGLRNSHLPLFNVDDLSSSWSSSYYLPEVFYYDTVDENGIITRSVYHAHNVPWNMTFSGNPASGLLEIIEVNNEPLETMAYFVRGCQDLQKLHLGDLSGKVTNKTEAKGYLTRIAYMSYPNSLNTIIIDKINFNGVYNLVLNLNNPLDNVGTIYIENLVESFGGGLNSHNSWLIKVLHIEYKFDSSIDTLPLCSTWDPGEGREDEITPADIVYRDTDNGDGTITRKIYHSRKLSYIRFSNKPGLLEVIRYNTTDLQSLRRMFEGCVNLTKIHDINEWDVSNVYITYRMFSGCTSLTELDLSKWDTRGIKQNNAQYMFDGCTNLKKINVSDWVLQGAISYMFNECTSLTEIIGIEDWDVSLVTNISATFAYCESLTELDLSNWDVHNVEKMMSTFHGCKNLKHIYGLENWDTPYVYTMYTLFYGCESIEELDIGNWDVSNVNNMSYMFANCESLKELDIVCWDTYSLTIASGMFNNCKKLVNLDLSGWDTHNLSSAEIMFAGSGVTHLNLSNWNVERLSYAPRMFANNNLKSINLAGWKIKYSASPNLSEFLNNCTKLEEVNLSNWNITNGYNITNIFTGDLKLKHIKMTGCNTSTINKIISSLPSGNTVENAKIFTSLNTELSYLNNTPSNWKVVKGDNIKSEKFLSEEIIKTLIGDRKVKRIHVGDTKTFYHK